MSAVLQDPPYVAALHAAEDAARAAKLPFAGSIAAEHAWELHRHGHAILVDVRSAEELKFVGHVPDTKHVAWASGTSLTRNPRFVRELEAKAKKSDTILLLCRSGKRSALAAEAATKAGFTHVFNIQEGFEGEISEQKQRGSLGGWRFRGLPWIQD